MEIELEVEETDPYPDSLVETLYESIKEEQEQEAGKVDAVLRGGVGGGGRLLYLRVCDPGDEFSRVRAVMNSWLRLLKIASDMVEVVREETDNR